MKRVQIKVDSRNRITLTKLAKQLPHAFSAYIQGNKIILEPLVEIPADEAWLFELENKEILEQIREGLKQKGTIKRGSFSKYSK